MSYQVVVEEVVEVTGGVDTHKDTHTAAAVDSAGRVLGSAQFPATAAGYQRLLVWLRSFGTLVLIGVEGTGAYGAGLARFLRAAGVTMVEIDRPDRKTRRWQGKSDPVDAGAAARAALAGRRTGTPKHRDGQVEALRALRIARRSAVTQRADTQRRIKALIVTAPDALRTQLRGLRDRDLITRCADDQPNPTDTSTPDTSHPDTSHPDTSHPDTSHPDTSDPDTATRLALRSLARRHQHLTTEITELDTLITPLTTAINPTLTARKGIGPDTAGQLLVTAGDNPQRLRSEAAFAMLCGTAPLPASSGNTHRHRLNRGGDRNANNAIWRIVITRMATDPAPAPTSNAAPPKA
jgi:transposase